MLGKLKRVDKRFNNWANKCPDCGNSKKRHADVILSVMILSSLFVIAFFLPSIINSVMVMEVQTKIVISDQFEEIGNSLVDDCLYEGCFLYNVEEYIMNDINYTSDVPMVTSMISTLLTLKGYTKDPSDTLINGGDCEDKATLAISIIKSYGIENNYLVLQYNGLFEKAHLCWANQNKGVMNFYGCSPFLEYKEILKV